MTNGNGNGNGRSRFWDWISGITATLTVAAATALVLNYSTDNAQEIRIGYNADGVRTVDAKIEKVDAKVEKIEKVLGDDALRDLKKSVENLRIEFRADMKEVRSRLREIETKIAR